MRTPSSAAVTRSRSRTAASSVAVGVLGRLVDQSAGAERVERVFLQQPVVDGVVQRRGGAGGEQRAAAQRDGAAVDRWLRRAPRSIGAQAPRVERRRVDALDLHLPLEPHRHPRLGPGRDADEVGIGALVERELAHLVGDAASAARARRARARCAGARPARAARCVGSRRVERHGGAVVGAVGAEAQHRLGLQPREHRRARRAPAGATAARDPLVVVRVVQQRLAREQQHLARHAAVAERADEAVAARSAPLISVITCVGQRQVSLPSAEPRPSPPWRRLRAGAAHRHHRLGREGPARRRAVDHARLGRREHLADTRAREVVDDGGARLDQRRLALDREHAARAANARCRPARRRARLRAATRRGTLPSAALCIARPTTSAARLRPMPRPPTPPVCTRCR